MAAMTSDSGGHYNSQAKLHLGTRVEVAFYVCSKWLCIMQRRYLYRI